MIQTSTLALIAVAGLQLEWTISDEGRFIPLQQLDAWLAQAAARGQFPMLCNGDESYLVTVSGLEIPAGLAPGGQPLCDIRKCSPCPVVTGGPPRQAA
jgi:hypothetical protein